MKYYVVSDVHGFYTEMIAALKEKGFFEDTEPHKLIVCGDMMDRGQEAAKMQEFMLDLLYKDELIFIRGNHEDLIVELVNKYSIYQNSILVGVSHHISNGTVDTLCQLADCSVYELYDKVDSLKSCPFFKELIPASRNYFETEHYIFVHGWIPLLTNGLPAWYKQHRHYEFNPDWRNAITKEWETARWLNGIDMAHMGFIEKNKTIVCGHWHCSYGHWIYGNAPTEFSYLDPYRDKGIIAVDACTAYSKKVNCIVLED